MAMKRKKGKEVGTLTEIPRERNAVFADGAGGAPAVAGRKPDQQPQHVVRVRVETRRVVVQKRVANRDMAGRVRRHHRAGWFKLDPATQPLPIRPGGLAVSLS
jgi:hypothetical protein